MVQGKTPCHSTRKSLQTFRVSLVGDFESNRGQLFDSASWTYFMHCYTGFNYILQLAEVAGDFLFSVAVD